MDWRRLSWRWKALKFLNLLKLWPTRSFSRTRKQQKTQQLLIGMLGFCVFFPQQNVFFFFFPSFGQCRLSDLFESFIENTFLFDDDDDDDVVVYEDVFFYIVYTHLQNYDIHPTSELVSSRCRVISSMSRTTAWRKRRMWQSNCKQRRNWWSATYRCGEDLICRMTHATRHGGWGPPSPRLLLVLSNLYEKVLIYQRGTSSSSFWWRNSYHTYTNVLHVVRKLFCCMHIMDRECCILLDCAWSSKSNVALFQKSSSYANILKNGNHLQLPSNRYPNIL